MPLACQAGALELGLQRGRAELQGIKHQREGYLRQRAAWQGSMVGQEGGGREASELGEGPSVSVRSVARRAPPAQRPLAVSVNCS
jgi:hypothetical protein